MSERKHTEGPWIADGGVRVQGGGYTLLRMELTPPHLCDFDSGKAYARCEANARLIAAAPDLLAACKAASDLLGDLAAQLNPSGAPSETHLIPLGVRAQLEAALAKAEGGA